MIGAIIGFFVGGVFGFVVCAWLVAAEEERGGRQ